MSPTRRATRRASRSTPSARTSRSGRAAKMKGGPMAPTGRQARLRTPQTPTGSPAPCVSPGTACCPSPSPQEPRPCSPRRHLPCARRIRRAHACGRPRRGASAPRRGGGMGGGTDPCAASRRQVGRSRHRGGHRARRDGPRARKRPGSRVRHARCMPRALRQRRGVFLHHRRACCGARPRTLAAARMQEIEDESFCPIGDRFVGPLGTVAAK